MSLNAVPKSATSPVSWQRVEEVLADVVPGVGLVRLVHSTSIQAGIRRDAAETATRLMGILQPATRR